MASLSVFEDKAGADKSLELARAWIAETAPNLFPNPAQVTEGSSSRTSWPPFALSDQIGPPFPARF